MVQDRSSFVFEIKTAEKTRNELSINFKYNCLFSLIINEKNIPISEVLNYG